MTDVKIYNKEEFYKHLRNRRKYRNYFEKLISIGHKKDAGWNVIGYCDVCNKPSKFAIDFLYTNSKTPNYRERLVCSKCNLNNRQRYMLAYLSRLCAQFEKPRLYMYEEITSFYQAVKKRLLNIEILGSEYLGFDKRPGEIVNGIHHEDALNLSFISNSFDLVVSNDVFEHVPDIDKASQEVFRVLKTGGKLIFSVPFHVDLLNSVKRAELVDNKINFILPPSYHGNPISQDGSLVFYDYGWNLLDIFKGTGFKDAYMLAYYSVIHWNIGEGIQFLFVAEK